MTIGGAICPLEVKSPRGVWWLSACDANLLIVHIILNEAGNFQMPSTNNVVIHWPPVLTIRTLDNIEFGRPRRVTISPRHESGERSSEHGSAYDIAVST